MKLNCLYETPRDVRKEYWRRKNLNRDTRIQAARQRMQNELGFDPYSQEDEIKQHESDLANQGYQPKKSWKDRFKALFREDDPDPNVICSWCGNGIYYDPRVEKSHGICKKCFKKVMDKHGLNDNLHQEQ